MKARALLRRLVVTAFVLLAAVAGVVALDSRGTSVAVRVEVAQEPTATAVPTPTAAPEPTATPTPSPTPTPTPEPVPIDVAGRVISSVDGSPVTDAVLTSGSATTVTEADGSFTLTAVFTDGDEIAVNRPVWHPVTVPWEDSADPLLIELDPVVVKALRVSRRVAADPEKFADLLKLADDTVVNTLVFDTKDESDLVLYETDVALANEINAVDAVYHPEELLGQAREHGLYTVTRIVTFEDPRWARAVPEAKLAGAWVDAADPENWEYPLDLAVEACELGFDEVQFDYVRFPSGRTAGTASHLVPDTEEGRVAAIAGFLGEARTRLHERGCGVSAAIFGIVMSSATDERLGQTPEGVSAVADAVSPMLYPSHYSPGWLGYPDPNDFPGPVVAYALDTGADRMAAGSLLRPWLQGFYYNGDQVRAQIEEADARGAGWIIWNAFGEYREDWLPSE